MDHTATKTAVNEKFMFARVSEQGFNAAGELEAVASTDELDRQNEVIEPEAWRETLPIYRTNPVILATHLHRLSTGDSPVIGSAAHIDIEDGVLAFRMIFAKTELGRQYEQLYRERHMRAFSVGYMPVTDEMRELTVDGQRKRVLVTTKADLLEISAVPVPANREALMRMRRLAAAAHDPAEVADMIVTRLGDALASRDKSAEGWESAIRTLQSAITAELASVRAAVDERIDEIIACLPDAVGAASGPGGPGRSGASDRAAAGEHDGADGNPADRQAAVAEFRKLAGRQ